MLVARRFWSAFVWPDATFVPRKTDRRWKNAISEQQKLAEDLATELVKHTVYAGRHKRISSDGATARIPVSSGSDVAMPAIDQKFEVDGKFEAAICSESPIVL